MSIENINVLAIDDNLDNLITIKALVMEAFPDAFVSVASSGKEGIDIALSQDPDVILLDIIMPDMDGFAVCEQLKADKKLCDIPVVFITALKGDKESRIRALEVGGEAFLAKPIDESELAAQLRAMAKIKAVNVEKLSKQKLLSVMVAEKTRELHINHVATLNLMEDLKTENEARRLSEEALIESERKFRVLMDNSPEGITIYVDEKIVYINKEATRMMGATDQIELLGTTITDFIHPDNRALVVERIKMVAMAPLNAILPSVEEKYIRLDGTEFDVEIKAMPIFYDGKPAIQLSGHDISDRKLAEQKLFESEVKYRLMFANNPQPMFIYDLDTLQFIEVNHSTIELYGYSRDEFLAMTLLDIRPKEDIELFLDHINLIVNNITTKNIEWRHLKKNGQIIYVEATATSLSSNRHRERHVLISDITDRKLAEDKIRKSEAMFRGIMEASPDSIIITGLDTRIEMISPVAISRLGYFDDKGFVGKYLSELVPVDEMHNIFADILQFLNGEKTGPAEYRALKRDGSLLDIEVNGATILNEKGEISKLIFVARDITERKVFQDALVESEYRFNSFIDNNIDRIFVKDDACRYLIVNDAMAEFFGKSKAEIINKTDSELTRNDLILPCQSSDLRALKADAPFILEEELGDKIFETLKFPMQLKGNKKGIGGIMRDVTARKHVEQQLIASKDQYQTIIENSNDLIWMFDTEGIFTFVNEQTTTVTRVRMEEWIGNSLVSHVLPEDIPIIMGVLQNTLNGEYCKYILRLKNDASEILYISVNTSPVYEKGELVGIISFGRDITKRRQIEEELERNRNELNAIYDNAPVMMCVIDENGQLLFGNKAFEKLLLTFTDQIYEYQVGDVIGCINALERGCGHGPMCESCNLRNAMKSTIDSGIDHTHIEYKTSILKSGELVEMTFLASTARINNGENNNILLCMYDITEMKRVEENLKELGDSYFGLFNTVQHAIFIHDPDMLIMDVNMGAINMYGYEKEFFIGKIPASFCAHGINDIAEISNYCKLAYEGIPQQYEFWGKRKDGTVFPNEVWTLKGKYFGKDVLITLANDISERKATEQVLLENESRLNIMFEFSPIAIWEEDFSEVNNYINTLKADGIVDFNAYFDAHPERVNDAISLIKVLAINHKNNEIFGTHSIEELFENIKHYFNSTTHIKSVFKNEIIALAEGKTSFESETQIINRNGELKYLYLNLIVIPGFETTLSRVLVSFIDITARKQAEEALQKSEMFLRTFIENTPFEIWARDVNRVGILENKKMVDHFGSILGKSPDDSSEKNPALIQIWEKNIKQVYDGKVVDEETSYIRNHQLVTYQQIFFPILNNQNVIGIAGFNIDITERKMAEDLLKKSQEQLKNFSAHLQTIREEEKIALAREIHDDLGQILVALKIDMGILSKKLTKELSADVSTDVKVDFASLMKLIENTIQTTRRIMNGLRPEQLEILGFVDAVKQYLCEFEERHGIVCMLDSNVLKIEMNSQKTLALFRILQESMTNVARHSKATQVYVKIHQNKKQLIFSIADNGTGFDMSKKAKSTSYGMIGMYERVTLIDGKLRIKSKEGAGTSVVVKITN